MVGDGLNNGRFPMAVNAILLGVASHGVLPTMHFLPAASNTAGARLSPLAGYGEFLH